MCDCSPEAPDPVLDCGSEICRGCGVVLQTCMMEDGPEWHGTRDGDGNELDPIQQTYHLMRLQRMAEAKFVALTDPALIELAGQASRLASSKMEVYWDLLSLQDPRAPPSTRAPRAYSVSI